MKVLEKGRQGGRRCSLVIVAEGAIDRHGKPISASYVKKVMENAGHDTRITILGHVQRGGTPSAIDRIAVFFLPPHSLIPYNSLRKLQSTLMGVAAVEWVLSAGATDEPVMIGMEGNKIVRKPLMQCVELV